MSTSTSVVDLSTVLVRKWSVCWVTSSDSWLKKANRLTVFVAMVLRLSVWLIVHLEVGGGGLCIGADSLVVNASVYALGLLDSTCV